MIELSPKKLLLRNEDGEMEQLSSIIGKTNNKDVIDAIGYIPADESDVSSLSDKFINGFTANGNISIDKSSGTASVIVKNATGAEGAFNVNTKGRLGIYDNKNEKWIIRSELDGTTYLDIGGNATKTEDIALKSDIEELTESAIIEGDWITNGIDMTTLPNGVYAISASKKPSQGIPSSMSEYGRIIVSKTGVSDANNAYESYTYTDLGGNVAQWDSWNKKWNILASKSDTSKINNVNTSIADYTLAPNVWTCVGVIDVPTDVNVIIIPTVRFASNPDGIRYVLGSTSASSAGVVGDTMASRPDCYVGNGATSNAVVGNYTFCSPICTITAGDNKGKIYLWAFQTSSANIAIRIRYSVICGM